MESTELKAQAFDEGAATIAASSPPEQAGAAAAQPETKRAASLNGWQAFVQGLRSSLRYPQVLFAAYLVNLFSAGVLALAPALMLLGPAHRLAIRDAANGLDDWLVVEVLLSPVSFSTLTSSVGEATVNQLKPWYFTGGLLVLVMPLMAWLPASFLSGGVLLSYAEAPRPFSWRRFLWGCWHWLGSFMLLNAVLGLLAQGLFVVLCGGVVAGWLGVGSWLNWITLPLTVLLVSGWLAWLESTRALAVRGYTRNIFLAGRQALKLMLRRPLAMAGLYGLALLCLLAVHALFRLGLMPLMPLAWWPLVFLLTQLFVLLRLWLRLARWAGTVAAAA